MRGARTITVCSMMVLLALGTPHALAADPDEEIRVGAIFDITGATSEVGADYAAGVQDCFRYINEEKGGINGRKVRLIAVDYQYNAAQAFSAYKRFVDREKVIAIMGWGTKDTEALASKTA
ncbi:MAG: ABC transporter substrate-binding protein, partial [Anaerolineae bacterium]|nr:ABC transporter substrate-binding protein [Anaerolineae bacterium]NIN98185.1 ABC transporter substrate-binding protein [Anaerolineae bacterium]NIQ81108.1 ABC transporter substrate-binding protein [Anaerolineae bacterium]